MLIGFLLCMSTGPISEVKLETDGTRLVQLSYERVFMASDGTYLAGDNLFLRHWDRNGQLLRQIGGAGDGPNALKKLGVFFWDGNHYWLVDSLRLKSLIYDERGRFLSENDFWCRQFLPVTDRFFVVEYKGYHPKTNKFPPVAREIRYRVAKGKLHVEALSPLFKKVSPKQVAFKMDHKLIWIVPQDDVYLVVEQLDPKIWIYDRAARQRESQTDNHQPFFPKFFPMELTRFIPHPDFSNYPRSSEEYVVWYYGWSRINYFGKTPTGFLVGYETPNPDNPNFSMQALEHIDGNGKTTGAWMAAPGYFMGRRDGKVYLLEEEGDGKTYRYYVRTYEF